MHYQVLYIHEFKNVGIMKISEDDYPELNLTDFSKTERAKIPSNLGKPTLVAYVIVGLDTVLDIQERVYELLDHSVQFGYSWFKTDIETVKKAFENAFWWVHIHQRKDTTVEFKKLPFTVEDTVQHWKFDMGPVPKIPYWVTPKHPELWAN